MPTNLENTIRGTNQNLLEQIPIEKIFKPKGFYKEIILDFLTVASALYFSYSARDFLETGAITGLALGVFPILIFSSLEVILLKSLSRRFFVLVLEAIALLSFFYDYQIAYLAAAGGFFLLFSIWGEILSRSEVISSIEVRFVKSTSPLLKKTVTALALLVIILYIPQWNDKNVFISERSFGSIFIWSTGFVHNLYPEINFNSTVDDLAKGVVMYEITGTHPYEDLPDVAKSALSNQLVIQTSEQLKKFLGGGVRGDEKISDVFYKIVVDSLGKWKEQFGPWFIAAWAAIVFLMARSFGVLFWWFSVYISFLIYQILVAVNFIAIRGETTTKESVVFP